MEENFVVFVEGYSLPKESLAKKEGNILLDKEGNFLCTVTSTDGISCFAPNFDGRGLERGKFTHFLAFRPVEDGCYRYTGEQLVSIYENYPEWVDEGDLIENGVFNFSMELFYADVEDLQKMVEKLGLIKEAEDYVPVEIRG